MMEEREFWETAVEAAMRAGEVILDNLGGISKDEIGLKQTADFVTRVDRETEKVIIETIRQQYPQHSFLAEESLKEAPAEYRWIIDPLDGTTNYIHGYPVFSISVALEHKGGIILGVVYDPLHDELFKAEKGQGSFLNGEEIHVSAVGDMENSLITTGFPFRMKHMLDPYLQLFRNIFHKVSDLRRTGSAAIDLAYLACGRCDGFFEIGLGPWDVAAGSIIAEEAGGIVTDFVGGKDYVFTGNIIAGNPFVQPAILREVREVFKGVIDK